MGQHELLPDPAAQLVDLHAAARRGALAGLGAMAPLEARRPAGVGGGRRRDEYRGRRPAAAESALVAGPQVLVVGHRRAIGQIGGKSAGGAVVVELAPAAVLGKRRAA